MSTELITLDQVEDVILHGGTIDIVPTDDVQADIARRVLEASDLAEAFQEYKATPAKQIEGELLTVHAVAWMQSTFEEGPGVYAMLQCSLAGSDEMLTVSMGGRSLMAAFLWAQRNEALPIRGAFHSQRSRVNPEYSYWTFQLSPEHVK